MSSSGITLYYHASYDTCLTSRVWRVPCCGRGRYSDLWNEHRDEKALHHHHQQHRRRTQNACLASGAERGNPEELISRDVLGSFFGVDADFPLNEQCGGGGGGGGGLFYPLVRTSPLPAHSEASCGCDVCWCSSRGS